MSAAAAMNAGLPCRASDDAANAQATAGGTRRSTPDLWVFAYGSLMWRPDFPYVEGRRARLTGYRRAFCVYSVHHRGTPERLGLVLGLDRGGVCEGVAYRIAAADVATVRAYLRARELVNGVYREAFVPVVLEPAGAGPKPPGALRRSCEGSSEGSEPAAAPAPAEIMALAYIVERAHHTYAGRLPLATQARVIRGAKGISGANLDYLVSTVRHLQALGIRERELERLVTMVGPLAWQRARAVHTSPYASALLRAERRRPPPVRLDARRERGQFQFRWKSDPWGEVRSERDPPVGA